jgi:hypothetical protein
MDMRSRGRSAKLVFERMDSLTVCLPSFPGDSRRASHALSILEDLKASFGKRLKKAKEIGDELESEMLPEELHLISESARLLGVVLEGYMVG